MRTNTITGAVAMANSNGSTTSQRAARTSRHHSTGNEQLIGYTITFEAVAVPPPASDSLPKIA